MKKLLSLLLFMLVLWSCKNEDDVLMNEVPQGFNVNTEFVKLSDNGTGTAGSLLINADVSEVSVRWNVNEKYNLDTTQTSVKLIGGKGVLPIKWREVQESGNYGPDDMLYNAGVMITAGDQSQYIPLIWAEKVDTAHVMQSMIKTRAVSDIPKAYSVQFVPEIMPMNSQSGGSVFVILENINFALFNYGSLAPAYNVDTSVLPDTIQSSRLLKFNWTTSGAPSFAFDAEIPVYTLEIGTTSFHVTYNPTGGGGGVTPPPTVDLHAGTIVPAGNIPDEGGTYYCNFTGTYTGQIILRATKNGIELGRGTGNKTNASVLLNVLVPGITGEKQATVSFEYSVDGGTTWTLIESRTQIQETLSVYPIQPTGYIPAAGGTVTCSVYGTYSKKITVHARVGDQIIASNSGSVPSSISLQIPANPGTSLRPIIFEYSKNGAAWLTLETKRQLGN